MVTATELQVRRTALADISVVERNLDAGPGQLLVHVDHFALTANNMTYAAHGVDMGYWSFFPASDGYGIVPVWGFASVVESQVEGIAVGARFYGYWPMASHAVVTPTRIGPRGFVDGAPHRQSLPAVYNHYVPASPDWGSEALQALFRPLYTTSFVLDALLSESPAATLILTSASSKTALGLAQAARGRQRVIGVTAAANIGFVESTGYYDQVMAYDALAETLPDGPVALVDFSGNGAVRHALHTALGDHLIESLIVGDTHWAAANSETLPGVTPKLFFAPSVIADRVATWGPEGFEQRLFAAWTRFMATTGWLQIVEASGATAAAGQWQALADGCIDPAAGFVVGV
ncbi:DUF2855 family protein [Polymorphobacter fuscus]|uniref:DUF2855 family protein n=1 Tax=Sandarakinorhabdus fusca TaxID=1439888 RepID=A0A7C9GTQ3_9SPHN|nr:DUF2855 family protein [Polymorphobacter fuscus]KAB7648707.1 DUF2855 family protein [Polymorphobacter fuscus]MQT16269.1 DUF2855 family protein [Polymorphobacter fuscus]NJC07446.1 hypothetical protein [Polymorphobacter fuscus]